MLNNEIRKQCYKSIREYFLKEFTDTNLRDLASDTELAGFAEFYLYYPYLFEKAFNKIDQKTLTKLNIAGFLCFKSVILKDNIVDNQIPKNEIEKNLVLIEKLQEKAKQELIEIFGMKDNFWSKWKLRETELKNGNLLDKTLNKNTYSFTKYKTFAWNKSAMAKLAIDSLYIIEGEKSRVNYLTILKSHKNFSCAMQLFDDVMDFIEDEQNNQFNIAVYLTKNKLQKKSINQLGFKPSDYEKYMYILGIANQIFTLSLKHIDLAIENIKELKIPYWNNVLLFYKKLYKSTIEGTNTYLNLISAETLDSKEVKTFPEILDINKNPNQINASLKKSIAFIKTKQNIQGLWSEYLTSAGASTIWATGFILFFIPDVLSKKKQAKTIETLLFSKNPIWGYKTEYINDSDSSAFVILALAKKQIPVEEYIALLIKRQNNDGGFPTYISEDICSLRKAMRSSENQSYDGWVSSHPCVSSVIYLLLNIVNSKELDIPRTNLKKYLLHITTSKENLTYWWTSEIYTAYFLVESSYINNDSSFLKLIFDYKIRKIILSQNNDGSFGDKYQIQSPFYTGLMILLLLRLKENGIVSNSDSIINAVTWLVKEQKKDGSWIATNAMKLPLPSSNNSTDDNWQVSQYGCEIRAQEYNRLFSTSVCTKALIEFQKLHK